MNEKGKHSKRARDRRPGGRRDFAARMASLLPSGTAPPRTGERDQSVIRLVIAVLILLYVAAIAGFPAMAEATGVPGPVVPTLFLLYALGLFVWVRVAPAPSALRRLAALVCDLGALSYILILTGPIGAPWYPIYLWVIFGNAIRYGLRYLYAGMALGVLGFSAVIALTPFWRENLDLGIGLLAGLLVLPLYAARLLQSLNRALARSEEASEAKSRFLANMSHELRTPLNGVIAVADLLGTTRLSAEQREMVRTAEASAATLLELIEQVLDISRIEAGKVTVERSPFDLYRLIQETAAILRPQGAAKGLGFHLFVDTRLPIHVSGDALRLRQALLNLGGNAVKFTERGRVSIAAHRLKDEEGTAQVRFEIADTGVGIAQSARSRVFEPFSQADESVTRRYGGTGLGTTIAKELVERMDGRIGFESRAGHGTTFWFELALAIEDESTAESREQWPRMALVTLGCDDAERSWLAAWAARAGVSVSHGDDPEWAVAALEAAATADKGRPLFLVRRRRDDDLPSTLARALRDRGLGRVPLVALEAPEPPRESPVAAGYLTVVALDDTRLERALHLARLEAGGGEEAREPQGPSTAGLRILLAEDNLTNQKVTRMILERAGHRVEVVADGQAALDRLEATEYDLAIVDMHMPQIDGIEVAQIHRFAQPHRQVPFLLLTADATEGAAARSEAAGLEEVLTKPVRAETLRAKVETLARRARAALEPAPERAAPVLEPETLADIEALGRNGRPFLLEVASAFVEDMARRLEGAERALRRSHWSRLRDEVHKLKGAAVTMGAAALAERCEALACEAPRALARGEAEERLRGLRAECERTQAALEAHLGSRLPPSPPLKLIEGRRRLQ